MMATLNMSMGTGGPPLSGAAEAPPASPLDEVIYVIGGEGGDIIGGEGGDQIGAG